MGKQEQSAGFWGDWGLTTVLILIFLVLWIGQTLTGWAVFNQDQKEHGRPQVSLAAYLVKPHFWEATTENWESEFLQMLGLVWLTVLFRQKGSPESNDPSMPPHAERETRHRRPPAAARTGGVRRKLYEHSLSITLAALFLGVLALHVVSGSEEYSNEQRDHGEPAVTPIQFLAEPQMWFESFQNWQSEFLASGLLVILTVYLREKGSSQSKPTDEAQDSIGE